MDLPEEWLRGPISWASKNECGHKLWLFGSYAKGCATSESDVDIALSLAPANGKNNWAAGAYVALHGEWKRQLEAIVGRHVSLEAIEEDVDLQRILLWTRD